MLATRVVGHPSMLLRGARVAVRTPNYTTTKSQKVLNHSFGSSSQWNLTFPRRSQQGSVRRFASRIVEKAGEGLKAKSVSTKSPSADRWRRIALYVKISRVPILIVAVYSLGYQQGAVDSVRNPLKIQQGTFESICQEYGVTSAEDVELISERGMSTSRLRRMKIFWKERRAAEEADLSVQGRMVMDVAREIIRAAKKYVREELQKATEAAKERLRKENPTLFEPENEQELYLALQEDGDVEDWLNARERIEGSTIDGILNWQYVLINTPVPNAFVSEMLPQRFFVTTALIEAFIENDDELAMILGHEISHLILGHGTERSLFEFGLRGIEILALMLDPTEGILSLSVAGFLASSRQALVAAQSRSNEYEADSLGCKLAAMACYDPKIGSKVFLKMHQASVGQRTTGLMSSHPASKERYETLQELSSVQSSIQDSYCEVLKKRVRRALSVASSGNE